MTGENHDPPGGRRLAVLSLAALGIVFGDIGTSPLYAFRECFHGKYGVRATPDNLLGVLCLMFWSLVIVVTIKYIAFVMRADNRGEGGVIALMALASPLGPARQHRRSTLVVLGLFAGALLYGDGMITPAISVLSAMEGLRIITPALKPYVVPATIVVLVSLFLLQRRGTAGIGAVFGPVILTWFCVIAVLGCAAIAREPHVLRALDPRYGAAFLWRAGVHGFVVLGAVFLVVTGAEALYADMGHFGKRPIRLAWFALVLPALVLNYFGQGALLLSRPEEAHHPFYALVPAWALVPMVILATSATIIASQAMISGAFSLTRQVIQLGYCPRLRIVHTSPEQIGQVYVPQINVVLMVATVGLVVGFPSSSRLAAAYGVAVTTTMLITTLLFYVVARKRWGWGVLATAVPVGIFLVVDLAFFSANMTKITHGAWFPLVVAGITYAIMRTWKSGRDLLAERLRAYAMPFQSFLNSIALDPPARVRGKAVFLTGNPEGIPSALLHNLKHNKILHAETAFLSVLTEEVPRVPREEKVEVQHLGNGFHKVVAHYGFMEDPNVPHILAMAREKGLDFAMAETSFFLGRERLLPSRRGGLTRWQTRIFAFLSRNALGATDFYRIPPNQVLEVGAQLQL